MTGTIIENLCCRKLVVIVIFLLLSQLLCFLIGGLVAPVPANAQYVLGTVCMDHNTIENGTTEPTKWRYARGLGYCRVINIETTCKDSAERANDSRQWLYHRSKGKCQAIKETDVVYTFQIPVPFATKIPNYSRWQQNMIGIIQLDISDPLKEMKPRSVITFDAKIGYQNKGDPWKQWKLYTQSVVKRNLDCDIGVKTQHQMYNCSSILLFELGSLHHDFYLLNIRMIEPPIGHIRDMWLEIINRDAGYTKLRLSLKTVFFSCIIAVLVWFWRRVHMLQRKPVLLEKMLLSLGVALSILNIPIEYLTLQFDLPFMKLLEKIREVVVYAILYSFWLVFTGEHVRRQDSSVQGSLKKYCRPLIVVTTGSVFLLTFDVCKQSFPLRNPFDAIWVTDWGKNIGFTAIILAGIFTGVYFLFLCYSTWQVFTNISQDSQSLTTIGSIHREQLIYRYKFVMLVTLICAAFTVIGFILGQVAEAQWTWEDNVELEKTSAFFIGVYGMWNIYIFALLILYAPSYKQSEVFEITADMTLNF